MKDERKKCRVVSCEIFEKKEKIENGRRRRRRIKKKKEEEKISRKIIKKKTHATTNGKETITRAPSSREFTRASARAELRGGKARVSFLLIFLLVVVVVTSCAL